MALSKERLRYLTSSYILLQAAFPATAFSLPPLHGVIFPSVCSPPTHQHVRKAHHDLCHLSNLAQHLQGASRDVVHKGLGLKFIGNCSRQVAQLIMQFFPQEDL